MIYKNTSKNWVNQAVLKLRHHMQSMLKFARDFPPADL